VIDEIEGLGNEIKLPVLADHEVSSRCADQVEPDSYLALKFALRVRLFGAPVKAEFWVLHSRALRIGFRMKRHANVDRCSVRRP
jgi:hypothetical protein